jgi:hypothetical protein
MYRLYKIYGDDIIAFYKSDYVACRTNKYHTILNEHRTSSFSTTFEQLMCFPRNILLNELENYNYQKIGDYRNNIILCSLAIALNNYSRFEKIFGIIKTQLCHILPLIKTAIVYNRFNIFKILFEYHGSKIVQHLNYVYYIIRYHRFEFADYIFSNNIKFMQSIWMSKLLMTTNYEFLKFLLNNENIHVKNMNPGMFDYLMYHNTDAHHIKYNRYMKNKDDIISNIKKIIELLIFSEKSKCDPMKIHTECPLFADYMENLGYKIC